LVVSVDEPAELSVTAIAVMSCSSGY
jgi:hypothetical protein